MYRILASSSNGDMAHLLDLEKGTDQWYPLAQPVMSFFKTYKAGDEVSVRLEKDGKDLKIVYMQRASASSEGKPARQAGYGGSGGYSKGRFSKPYSSGNNYQKPSYGSQRSSDTNESIVRQTVAKSASEIVASIVGTDPSINAFDAFDAWFNHIYNKIKSGASEVATEAHSPSTVDDTPQSTGRPYIP